MYGCKDGPRHYESEINQIESEIEREKVRLNVSNSVFEAEVGIKKRTNVKNRCKMRNGGL